jgi:hypothetical protein
MHTYAQGLPNNKTDIFMQELSAEVNCHVLDHTNELLCSLMPNIRWTLVCFMAAVSALLELSVCQTQEQ